MKTLKLFNFIAFLGLFGWLFTANVIAQETSLTAEFATDDITAQSLGIDEPTVLPGDTGYWWQNFKEQTGLFFTFDKDKKADKELNYANTKLLEAKKLVADGNTDKLEQTLERYKKYFNKASERIKNNPGNDKEIFSLDELIKDFDIKQINKAGAVFDTQKLNWFNSQYIKNNYENIVDTAQTFLPGHEAQTLKVLKLFGSRQTVYTLSELPELTTFLWELPSYPADILVFKKSDKAKTTQGLKLALAVLQDADDWKLETLDTILKQIVNENKLSPGDVFWPIRVALSGLEQSPSPAEILEFLGKEESLSRIKQAIDKL